MFLIDTAAGSHHRGRRDQARARRRASRTASGSTQKPQAPRRPARGHPHHRVAHATCCVSSRPSATPTRSSSCSSSPMARTGVEALGSMGTDTPLAVLSNRPRLLFDYFKQLFAQVTNPPLDAIREELVTSVVEGDRARGQPAGSRDRVAATCWRSRARSSTTTSSTSSSTSRRRTSAGRPAPIACLYPVAEGGDGPAPRARPHPPRGLRGDRRRRHHPRSCPTGRPTRSWRPIPSLLATAAVHHHLIREKTRTQVGLIIETGEAREVHHFACCSGTARRPINPYLAFDTIEDRIRERAHRRASTSTHAVEELHQGRRQGRAQGHVQDGHLDRRVLHRRADLRGHRPRRASSSTSTSPAPSAASAASASTRSPRRSAAATRRAYPRPSRGARPPRPRLRRRVPVAP